MKLNVSEILKGLGEVATTLNPVVGSGLMLAGAVADQFDGIPDNVLQNNFIGFEKSAEIIRNCIKDKTLSDDDIKALNLVADNLDGINKLLSKIIMLIK